MTISELDKKLKTYLLEGLPDDFIKDCSMRMSSLNLTPERENLARTLFLHLSTVLKFLTDNERPETMRIKNNLPEFSSEFKPISVIEEAKRIIANSGLPQDFENMAFAMGYCCYAATVLNKKSGEDFLTLYADSWFLSI